MKQIRSLLFANTTRAFRSFRHFLYLVPALALAMAGNAQAQTTLTWVGSAGSSDLNNAANWTGDVLPTTGADNLTFGTTSNATTLTDTLVAAFGADGITFNSGASAFTLTGNSLTLDAGVSDNATATETINNALILSTNHSFQVAAGGDLVLGGGLSGAFTVTVNSTGGDTGTLTLNGSSAFSFTTINIDAGTLALTGAAQLGSGTFSTAMTDDGTLSYGSSAAQTLSGIISGTGGR